MSSYTDSIQAYAHGKSRKTSGGATSSPAAASTSASASAPSYASSVYSEASYYKDTSPAAPKQSSPMTKAIKSWTKELVSDIGKSPTHRYDAAHAASSSSANSTNALGAPYWADNRPGKM
ncbi:hypothetical protein F503_04480 [Ophiostoma piceae UAMH 11346]|uniref:Uncharacterized protein n=1 Tax=Ophiostoma piceae (strain UAMH 11346) TaxID=1262450 RepID=S3CQM5_OPHP1|nr:hypothetical protein F503_04480 [Ophiostoma piceae UAMH 11346]